MVSVLKRINLLFFFMSFAIGLLFVYIFTPPPQVVIKFPTPYNSGQVVYKDKNDGCFLYKAEKVTCPYDKTLIKPQPIEVD